MLKELVIENLAVIEKAQVTFDRALNVLTVETGAGKSILIDAINAITGNRTSKEIVRTGEERAVIWAVFQEVGPAVEAMLSDMGYQPEGELVLNREIQKDGRTRCRINGRPASASQLREVCVTLINIHGQHDSQALLDPEKHIHILDAFGALQEQVRDYSRVYGELTKTISAIRAIDTDEAAKQRRMDLLSYQIEEITAANLRPGEEEALAERRAILRNSEKLSAALHEAAGAIDGQEQPGALELLYSAAQSLGSVAPLAEQLARTAERLNDLYYALADAAEDIKASLEGFSSEDEDIDSIEGRLDLIHRLKLKYGGSVDEVLEFLKAAQEELSAIETGDQRLLELEKQREALTRQASELADRLTARRREAFSAFQRQIKSELQFLNMPDVAFSCSHRVGELGPGGRDSIEFLISTNPGEPPKPMAKIASGGELSRIMLAIKNVLADKDEIKTLIFDEVDTGVSGSGAQKIGTKLKQASASRQIICVTHSAAIAAYADCHLFISKGVREGRTYTSVQRLGFEQRKREIARIISGDLVSDTAIKNAEEMLLSSGSSE